MAREVEGLVFQTARATDGIVGKIDVIQSATKGTVDMNASIASIVKEVRIFAERTRVAMEAQAQTARAITSAIDETALAAGSLSSTIAVICDYTDGIVVKTDVVDSALNLLSERLLDLKSRASRFATRGGELKQSGRSRSADYAWSTVEETLPI